MPRIRCGISPTTKYVLMWFTSAPTGDGNVGRYKKNGRWKMEGGKYFEYPLALFLFFRYLYR